MANPDYLKTLSPRPFWFRKTLGFLALFFGSTIVKIKTSGKWNLPKTGPYILASNHFSYIDPPFSVYAAQKPISFLAASDEPIKWYFMWAPHLYGFIPIDRNILAPSTIKKAKKALKKGEILGIFPEGTSMSAHLRKPKNGAVFLSTIEKAKIVPMGIHGADNAWSDLFRGIRPRVFVNIGKPFGPFEIEGEKSEKTKKLDKIGKELICRIAALLPSNKHGAYAGEKQIIKYQNENGFYPEKIKLK